MTQRNAMYRNDFPMPYVPPAALRKTAATALVCAFLAGTGGDTGLQYFINRQDQGYRFRQVECASPLSSWAMSAENRSTLTTLNRIREILRLSISDLAAACKVSRQAVYKWISGSSASLALENQNRLDDLYLTAELFATRGVSGSAALLKRKDNSGKNLVDAMRAGDSAQTWARGMLDTLALESRQRATLDARLRARKRSAPTPQEWGVPMMSETDA